MSTKKQTDKIQFDDAVELGKKLVADDRDEQDASG